MRDELLGYYERELAFLRQMGGDFAHKYPKIASRLLLEADKCEDPHVERLIEAFAFLAGRVHLKVDDEFPEITESFLNVLYPHYLAPIPSMSIVRFAPKEGTLTTGYPIPRGTGLYSRPIQGTPCRFRTGYNTTLWPIEVISASLESLDPVDTRGKWGEAVIKITLSCMNDTALKTLRTSDSQHPIESLRFYLNGEPQVVYPLYEMIFNHATRVEIRPGPLTPSRRTKKLVLAKLPPVVLPPSAISQVGFEPDQGLLQYTPRSFPGYRLLSEYFALPEKFLFFDLKGLDQAALAGFQTRFDIYIYLRDVAPVRGNVNASTFQLGCTPVINLFSDLSEPIRLTSRQHEYHVVPDIRRHMAMEVYSIDSVVSDDPQLGRSTEYQPFYSFHHFNDPGEDPTFWYSSRRASQRPEDPGSEVYLTLVDLGFNPHVPATNILTVHTTCTNRDLPARLPWGGAEGDLEAEGAAPLSHVRCLTKPTPTMRPAMGRGTQWRLISHLSLNHLSLVGKGADGSPEALREILFLYDLMDSSATRRQIRGLKSVKSKSAVRQMGTRIGAGFVRGIETTLEFDEEQYVGSGLFLFASVLEKFLGLYASVNSFNQLVAVSSQREGIIKRWPPRAGNRSPLAQELFDEPYRFGFFQAVRLLERMYPDRHPVGRDTEASGEVVRFRTRQTLSFPAAEIHELTQDAEQEKAPPEMLVAFMGLTGPLGILPYQYTELLMERARYKDTALWSFLDIFNHRMISLFYRVWEKYHFPIAYERTKTDPFTAYLFDIVGLGTSGLRGRLPFKDQALLPYAGLISQTPHSSTAIGSILSDYFGVAATVVQFPGEWLKLGDNRTSLGSANSELGLTSIAGAKVWCDQSCFRVRVGPLSLKKFQSFVPVGSGYQPLVELVRLLVGLEFEFDIQLVLQSAEVPYAVLNANDENAPRLGWTSWLKTCEFAKDDDQVRLATNN